MKKRTSEEVEWWDGKRGELGRQPTLPDAEREERVETSADKVGVFVDSVRRSGWTLSEDRRSGQEGVRTRRGVYGLLS